MSKRIVITGATGLIGSHITKKLIERKDEVIVFSRSPEKAEKKLPNAHDYVEWSYDEIGEWKKSIDGADVVIHLAGENVMAERWNEEHKQRVLKSREIGTRNIVEAIKESSNKPEVLICASAIGIYDDSPEAEYDEDGKHGDDFLTEVTEKWEAEAEKVEDAGVRRVSIRTGIVLDKNEGALAQMLTPFKFFVGGPIGSGKQWMSWIHIDDIANLYLFAIDNKDVQGVLNGTAPNPVRMNEFAKTLGKVMNRPSFFNVPKFVLKIVLGEGAGSVLRGSKIIPAKTKEAGFSFKFSELDNALREVLS